MRRTLALALLLVAAVGAACRGDPGTSSAGSQLPVASAAESWLTATPTAPASRTERRPLPTGFPVLPGAVPMAMADGDPGLIGLWSTGQTGSAAYDFYVVALPGAGYPIVGLYPGGDVAAIRFLGAGGATWQMVAHGGASGTVAIEIRLDRP